MSDKDLRGDNDTQMIPSCVLTEIIKLLSYNKSNTSIDIVYDQFSFQLNDSHRWSNNHSIFTNFEIILYENLKLYFDHLAKYVRTLISSGENKNT